MANWFIDTELPAGDSTGVDFDNAFHTWDQTNAIGAAGDYIWVRRRSNQVFSADCQHRIE